MKLTLLATSDIHGYLVPTNYVRQSFTQPYSLERVATGIKKLQKHCSNCLTFDDGDYLEGSVLTHYLRAVKHQKAPTQLDHAFNQIHYDYGIVGNHEFNYGEKYLKASIAESKRQFLCANITDQDGNYPFGKPYVIRQIHNLKVGIVGFTTQGANKWNKAHNITNLRFNSVVQTAKMIIPQLRKQTDLIIVAYHGGFERNSAGEPTEDLAAGENESYQLLKEVPGIDALLTGHQHRLIADHLFGVPVIQPGHRGEDIGVITLEINAAKQVVKSTAKLVPTKDDPVDPKLTAFIKPLEKEVDAWLDEPLAKTSTNLTIQDPAKARLTTNNFVQFINQIQQVTMHTQLSATSLFNNEGCGFPKQITRRNVITNYVFPNRLAASQISGKELKQALEHSARYFTEKDHQITVSHAYRYPKPLDYCYDMFSGINYTINVSKPAGKRIQDLTYQGHPISDQQTFTIALSRFRAVGGGHYPMYHPKQILRTSKLVMDQIIIHYLKKHPEIKIKNAHNFKVIK